VKQCPNIKQKKYWQKYKKVYPWSVTYQRITTRCQYDKNNRYYKKGIKCLITPAELKYLWFRDRAYLLKQPSIDRINPKADYTLENCRFIELEENIKPGQFKTKRGVK
jgi:hypothetical protein